MVHAVVKAREQSFLVCGSSYVDVPSDSVRWCQHSEWHWIGCKAPCSTHLLMQLGLRFTTATQHEYSITQCAVCEQHSQIMSHYFKTLTVRHNNTVKKTVLWTMHICKNRLQNLIEFSFHLRHPYGVVLHLFLYTAWWCNYCPHVIPRVAFLVRPSNESWKTLVWYIFINDITILTIIIIIIAVSHCWPVLQYSTLSATGGTIGMEQ